MESFIILNLDCLLKVLMYVLLLLYAEVESPFQGYIHYTRLLLRKLNKQTGKQPTRKEMTY